MNLLHKLWALARSGHRGAGERVMDAPGRPTWLPTTGNMILSALVITILVWTQTANATNLAAPAASAPSTSTVNYQGRLANTAGQPLTGVYDIVFRLYNSAAGGTALWTEAWTGGNSVQVNDGLFSVVLGSLTPIPQAVVTGNSTLFLGMTVGADSEMTPRVQLNSVPFAVQALTVPDGSITQTKLSPDLNLVPSGVIVMWHGSVESIPTGWVLCNGANGTPDLRDRFVVGAGSSYAVGATGGLAQVPLLVEHLPAHNHGGATNTTGAHTHTTYIGGISRANNGVNGTFYFPRTDTYNQNIDPAWNSSSSGEHSHTISSQGGNQAHENRPPYYALALICKL